MATGERAQRPIPQVLEAEEVDRVLDPPAHGFRRHAEVLHGVGQFVLDALGDEAGQGVLADEAHDVGQFPRPVLPGRSPVDGDVAGAACRR